MKGAEQLKCLKSDGHKDDHEKANGNNEFHVENTYVPSRPTDDESDEARGVFANKVEFFLAIMGYTVGIGSVWRFPIICSRNGGGAFLIPYFFFLITSGGPLYYLEVCLGQFSGKSAAFAFEFCPLLKGTRAISGMTVICIPSSGWLTGVGLVQVILSLTVTWYFTIILAWVFYFLFYSFFPVLPWTTCDNAWNTPSCKGLNDILSTNTSIGGANGSMLPYNVTSLSNGTVSTQMLSGYSSSAFEFWEHNVIGRSKSGLGLEDLGSIQPHLVLCLFISWLFVVLALIKGVKSLGKVVYITATAPYVLITVMLIKGLTLEGSLDGLRVYLMPDFSKLLSLQVWLEAAIQVFYSLGPSWGGVITMASYNKFHQKTFWSTTLVCVSAGFTSFYNGLSVFAILGFMAKQSGRTVEEVALESGPGLTFVAFPTAISQMPVPQFWSVLFFLTLVTVMFDSIFGMLETVTSGIIDMFPKQLMHRRTLVNILSGLAFFVAGLPLTMNNGIYIFNLADWYFSQFGLFFSSLLEVYGVCWIYGTDRFSRDISIMTGRDVSVLLRVFWSLIIPVIVTLSFVTMLTQYSVPNYGDGYVYNSTAIFFGMFVGLLPIIAAVAVGAFEICRADGSFIQRFSKSLQPSSQWKPNNNSAQETYEMKPYVYKDTWMQRLLINIRGTKENSIY